MGMRRRAACSRFCSLLPCVRTARGGASSADPGCVPRVAVAVPHARYLYLLFDDTSHIAMDEWVFNTEAHPTKIFKRTESFIESERE